MFQQMGFGVAIALLLDATVIRSVVLPSTLTLLDQRSWYLPRWLEWLPHVEVERAVEAPASGGPLSASPSVEEACSGFSRSSSSSSPPHFRGARLARRNAGPRTLVPTSPEPVRRRRRAGLRLCATATARNCIPPHRTLAHLPPGGIVIQLDVRASSDPIAHRSGAGRRTFGART